jgi:hypothetical protein
MSRESAWLDAGGLLSVDEAVDGEAVERVVARSYSHPALGSRVVVRLSAERLLPAEDLAMEFLGFGAQSVTPPLAVQRRGSMSFAAWALSNDPANARYALDLVKRMKKAARLARSKPGHAWDEYVEMAKELGRSVRHFLPPFWEESGRAYKDLGNTTYAGRALTKSLEAERVHALESDRARRRDVVLEFVLAGCIAGKALSDYGADLAAQYPPAEAYQIFRDLCVRRTRGGMPPWASLPGEFAKLAQAAGLDAAVEFDQWLEELIDTPAMARAANQFWKNCAKNCRRIVARNSAFAISLLRHTRPTPTYYGTNSVWEWFDLLEGWGVLEFLVVDGHRGAPALGEPLAEWFGRVVRCECPAPDRVLQLLELVAPRLKQEGQPLQLGSTPRYGRASIDIDLLEACLGLQVKVDVPPARFSVDFNRWLEREPTHALRNQDLVHATRDERFTEAVFEGFRGALASRGLEENTERWRTVRAPAKRAFPQAARERPGLSRLWRRHGETMVSALEQAGLASFESLVKHLRETIWADALRLFPETTARFEKLNGAELLARVLREGCIDELGWPALERLVEKHQLKIESSKRTDAVNVWASFPRIVVIDNAYAYSVDGADNELKHELRLPPNSELTALAAVGNELAIGYTDKQWQRSFHWTSDPQQVYSTDYVHGFIATRSSRAIAWKDGGAFLGHRVVRPGDKEPPVSCEFLSDGLRVWKKNARYEPAIGGYSSYLTEVDPETGKELRASVPAWFEHVDGGRLMVGTSDLLPAPAGTENSLLGVKNGFLGWKVTKRSDGAYRGEGIDGRCWDSSLHDVWGEPLMPVGMLRRPGADDYWPIIVREDRASGTVCLMDHAGRTEIAVLSEFQSDFAWGQVTLLPQEFWHFLQSRHEPSSRRLRGVTADDCRELLAAATRDRKLHEANASTSTSASASDQAESPLVQVKLAVKQLLPDAPPRMVLGIARLIERVEQQWFGFETLRQEVLAEARGEVASGQGTSAQRSRVDSSTPLWSLPSINYYHSSSENSLANHLEQVAAFFRGERDSGELPSTDFVWFSLIEEIDSKAWATAWRVAVGQWEEKIAADSPWWELLEWWRQVGISTLPGRFDAYGAAPTGAPKRSYGGYDLELEAGRSRGVRVGDDRFVIIESQSYNSSPYMILRYSLSPTPIAPPGFDCLITRPLKTKHNPESWQAFVAKVQGRSSPPIPTAEELSEVADRIGVSPEEVGLVWMGGVNLDMYGNNFLPAQLRTALGWKLSAANAARQSLKNVEGSVRQRLYDSIVALGLNAPFAEDRRPVWESLEKEWLAVLPRRIALEPALQKRLVSMGSRYHANIGQQRLLEIASAPETHPLLEPRAMEIKRVEDDGRKAFTLAPTQALPGEESAEPIDLSLLKSIVQLIAVVHAETPLGHAARTDVAALTRRVVNWLDDARSMLRCRELVFHRSGAEKSLTPLDWMTQQFGEPQSREEGGESSWEDHLFVVKALDAQDRLFIALRPSEAKGAAEFARTHGILASEVGWNDRDASLVTLLGLFKSAGFRALARALEGEGLPAGRWPHDPRLAAPAAVEAVRERFSLNSEAATLYLQLLSLPEPSDANVRQWNEWSAATLKAAGKELLQAKLVLEAKRARAGRSLFLPGEWLENKTPWLPVEAWKLGHLHDVDPAAGDPLATVGFLVFRPFEQLFTAAWERVQRGDSPRYEEAQVTTRKKGTKK